MIKDDILFHYSSITGIHGILASGCLWATDYRYLNDTNELSTAIDMLIKSCDSDWHEALKWGLHHHLLSRSHFVISFSKSPKVLSQWRAYADDGKGAAIGFRSSCLGREYLSNTEVTLVECKYDDHPKEIIRLHMKHENTLKHIVNLYNTTRGINVFMEELGEDKGILDLLFDDLLSIKNEAFVEEQEVRLVIHTPKNEVKLRSTSDLIVPYVVHHYFPPDDRPMFWYAIDQIWLGPKCDIRNMESFEYYDDLGRHKNDIQVYDCGYK